MLTFEHLTTDFGGRGASRRFAEVPENCPLCHHHIDPRRLTANATSSDNTAVDFAFQCPRAECRHVFVGQYRLGPDGEYDLLSVSPLTARREDFSPEIRAFCPPFVEVHHQAQEAEARGLHQLAAMGFRNALELLVKEHAMREDPEAAEAIWTMPLGACVARYVADPTIQACAARAAWLDDGDALHLRHWESRDPTELRTLVRLTVNWLENVLLARKYFAEAAVAA